MRFKKVRCLLWCHHIDPCSDTQSLNFVTSVIFKLSNLKIVWFQFLNMNF